MKRPFTSVSTRVIAFGRRLITELSPRHGLAELRAAIEETTYVFVDSALGYTITPASDARKIL